MSMLEPPDDGSAALADASQRGPSPAAHTGLEPPTRSYSPSRPPTSAEIDAVIATAMANAPPAPSPPDIGPEMMNRSVTPLMTNLLPSAVGQDGRVNLFVGNLPYRVRWQDLKDLFRKAGTVLRADVSLGPDNRSRGYGTVLMGSREDAARAIDRFNGYTWQTRTLEVRPDRLPPEYEPQPHPSHHMAPPRPPMYTYHNMSTAGHAPFSLPGHLTPSSGPTWLPGQMSNHRPPNTHGMMGSLSLPPGAHPISISPHPPNLTSSNSLPIPNSTSPGSGYEPLPLRGQNTGNTFQPLGASPLAGSLTSGTGPSPSILPASFNSSRRESLTPFGHAIAPNVNGIPRPPQTTSPALVPGLISRPPSSSGKISPPTQLGGQSASLRAPPPGGLGSLTPPMFADARTVISPAGFGVSGSDHVNLPHSAPQPMPIAMEGLTHQSAHMGPPNTLHDRVVFVSNLPLTMQWQELKDLLRPAGIIIRADVASDSEGRPRGFGTALFASETDAAKAVDLYDGREIAGKAIRVHLERDTISDLRRSSQSSSNEPSQESKSRQPPDHSTTHQSQRTSHESLGSRLPWSLNTIMNGVSSTPSRTTPIGPDTTPQPYRPHHPGPISMPSFHPFDTPGGRHPLSPLQTRGLPPMTPSMPGFVFSGYAETPPIHPHFLSPTLGPFSPGLPVTSPNAYQYNPFAAPGAPIPRFPQGGSAALGTPTTQAFPNNPITGYQPHGAPGQQAPSMGQVFGDYFAPAPGTPEPSSPSPISSRAGVVAPSPLNARDRMASSTSAPRRDTAEALPEATSALTLDPSPTTKTSQLQQSSSGSEERENGRIGSSMDSVSAARASLDGPRPNLAVWDSGERRASFGDIVAGRARSEDKRHE